MGSIPFHPIYNHVVAHNIAAININPIDKKYTPSQSVIDHIQKKLSENPLKVDGVVWKVWSTQMDWATGIFTIDLGVCRYSEFINTSCDPELRKAVPDSREWANAAAPGALVLTIDNQLVFTRRPADARLSPGRIDMVCGHPTGLEELPSNENLSKAVEIVVKKELGQVTILGYKPLVVILEEPKLGHDIVFGVQIRESAREVLALGKAEMTLENDPESVSRFLQEETNCSRPVHLSLAYYGRKFFGEQWFIDHCYDSK